MVAAGHPKIVSNKIRMMKLKHLINAIFISLFMMLIFLSDSLRFSAVEYSRLFYISVVLVTFASYIIKWKSSRVTYYYVAKTYGSVVDFTEQRESIVKKTIYFITLGIIGILLVGRVLVDDYFKRMFELSPLLLIGLAVLLVMVLGMKKIRSVQKLSNEKNESKSDLGLIYIGIRILYIFIEIVLMLFVVTELILKHQYDFRMLMTLNGGLMLFLQAVCGIGLMFLAHYAIESVELRMELASLEVLIEVKEYEKQYTMQLWREVIGDYIRKSHRTYDSIQNLARKDLIISIYDEVFQTFKLQEYSTELIGKEIIKKLTRKKINEDELDCLIGFSKDDQKMLFDLFIETIKAVQDTQIMKLDFGGGKM